METTKHPLPDATRAFFYQMREYVGLPLYFYGSIQRPDYIPGKSDIDVMIFADYETSVMEKLSHFLKRPHSSAQKIVWDLHGHMVYGYKIKYDDEQIGLHTEISVYNERFRPIIQPEQTRKFILPWYILWLLHTLKILYYQLHLITTKQYTYYKRLFLNTGLGDTDTHFLVL